MLEEKEKVGSLRNFGGRDPPSSYLLKHLGSQSVRAPVHQQGIKLKHKIFYSRCSVGFERQCHTFHKMFTLFIILWTLISKETFHQRTEVITQSHSIVTNGVKPQHRPCCFTAEGKGPVLSFKLSRVQTSL